MTRSTRPSLPLSRPLITRTWSLRRMSTTFCISQTLQLSAISRQLSQFLSSFFSNREPLATVLQNFRRQGNDLQKFLLAQFARHGTEHARPNRLAAFIDQHRGIRVEADICAVAPAMLFPSAHDHGLDHGALFR